MSDRMAAFHDKHDSRVYVPQRIREALERLAADKSDGLWCYEPDLCKLASVSSNDLAAVREQFRDHVVNVPKNGKRVYVWCGTPAIADTFRKVPGAR